MKAPVSDAAALRPADTASRRGSFGLLSGAMLAVLAAPLSAQARNGNGNGAGKKANKRCKRQVDGCRTAVLALCGGSPTCVAGAACCSSLGTCNADGFFACVAALSSN